MSSTTLPTPRVNSTNNEISCSIEETNRIRASLGLKPLRISSPRASRGPQREATKAENEKQKVENEKVKVAESEKKKDAEKSLFAPKSIAESALDEDADDVEDIEQWISRSRRNKVEGVDLKGNDVGVKDKDKVGEKEGKYDEKDVEGMQIRHDVSTLVKEGEDIVLTLADRSILDENGNEIRDDEDQLESVLISEKERGKHHASLRRKRVKDINPYEEEQKDEEAGGEGAKKVTVIQRGGIVKENREEKSKPKDDVVMVDAITAPTFESDYYTPTEYAATFKKPSKKRNASKKRRRRKAEDDNEGSSEKMATIAQQNGEPELVKTDAIEAARLAAKEAREAMLHDDADDLDDAARYAVLENARKQRAISREKELEKIIDRFEKTSDETGQGIMLNELEEFARGVGDEGRSLFPSRPEENDEEREMEVEEPAKVEHSDRYNTENVEEKVERNENQNAREVKHGLNDVTIKEITEEAPVSSSVAAALAAFRSRGDLQAKSHKVGRAHDKILDDTRGDSRSGRKEIKLEYVDEYGRELTPKEAFRMMCYKFHGKGPGKNKKEKRLGRYLQELKLRSKMSGGDTPLGGVKALKEVQKKTGSVGVVIQGKTAMREALDATKQEETDEVEVQVIPKNETKEENVTEADLKRSREEEPIEFEFGNIAPRAKRSRLS